MNWQALNDTGQLEKIKTSSNNPDFLGILIFKHSTRCATSAMVLERLERGWSYSDSQLPVYFLDLLCFPSVSDEIASVFGVQHESPQVLLIKDGICVYTDSHTAISVKWLTDSIQSDNK